MNLWEERFQSLIRATSEIVWTTDAQGSVVEDSPSWRAFTGQTYEQWKGWGWLDAIHPDDRDRVRTAWTAAVEERAAFDIEYRLRRADGRYAWMQGHAAPVIIDDVVREWVGINIDVTERTQIMLDQREANAHLVHATIGAQELSDQADIARAHAEDRERALREMSELQEMFIGILGHDLRNPLGAILMGAATMVRRGQLDEQDGKTVARIIRSCERMTRMIAQLLDLTRARLGGGLPIERASADMSAICQNVVEEFSAPIRLKVDEGLTGNWDADRLVEAMSNIVGNAIQHGSPQSTVVVKARAEGPDVIVEICNAGEPIPSELLPFIFDPFRRAKVSGKNKAGNLGLGLYIAQQIVVAHGGTIDAHSANGTTVFTLRLPREER